jgi:hypothetical protein
MPNAPPSLPHQELTESPRVSPIPLGSPSPRVHTTPISPATPGTLPTHAPTNVQIPLFPPEVPRLSRRRNTAKQQLGTAPRLLTNTSISHLEIPTPITSITRKIMPHEPFPPLAKLGRSQQIANLGILVNKLYPVDGPACNTCSQTQVRTITQEALMSCIHNYGEATSRPVVACRTAQRQYPTNMLHAVLNKTTGHLMKIQQLLVNPKCKELGGKSYMKELGRLAQGMPRVSKGTDTIVFIRCKDIPHDCKCNVTYARVCVNYCPEKEDPNRTRVTAGGNLLHYPGDCGTPTVSSLSSSISTTSYHQRMHAIAPLT